MLTTPMPTSIDYGSPTDDVFKHDTAPGQSPCDGSVGLPPPPPPPPAPPVFGSNMNISKPLLPHQEVNLIVNKSQSNEIPARSVPTMLMAGNNIWTRCVIPNLRIKQTVFDQHYGENKSTMTGHYRRSSLTTNYLGGGGGGTMTSTNDDGPLSFVLLDATSKMLYDVPMRHLLQLVKKDHDDDASIDHVIRAIDETQMKSEWLDAVTALNKQFDKRPEDKARVLAHKGSTQGLVLIEQFFVKLVRVPAYEFKLIYLKFREEAPTQLERMSKHIQDLLESVQVILTNEQLPGILHLLCLLYNSITGKSIPGLHFDSILSVLSTRTPKQNSTVAHVLCHLLEEQYPNLLNIFDDQVFVKLKDLSLIKYIPIYIDIRVLYTRYKQLNSSLRDLQQQMILLPEHIKSTLNDLQVIFTTLFDDENKIKKCEKDLASYFCVWDLPLETCLSTLGQFIDKARLAHMQNVEQRRRNELLLKQQQRLYDHRILSTPTTSRLLRNSQSQYGSDTNIFRDHLNVPLTPTTTRQRFKVNKIVRERFSASSRDVSYLNDDQNDSMETMIDGRTTNSAVVEPQSAPVVSSNTATRTQNLLPNATPPRKRGHSPATKTIFTKRPFNALPISPPVPTIDLIDSNIDQQSDDVFSSPNTSDRIDDDQETKMDCSTHISSDDNHDVDSHSDEDHLLPSVQTNKTSTAPVISVCEIRPSFYLTATIQRPYDSSNDIQQSNDQSAPHSSTISIDHSSNYSTPITTDYHRNTNLTDRDNEHNKENEQHKLTMITPTATSLELQAPAESCPLISTTDDENSQQSSSSSSTPLDEPVGDHTDAPMILLSTLSDSETLDEGFETQSNISEIVEANSRTSPTETHPVVETKDIDKSSTDEALAEELTRRLNFTTTRRFSHDSSPINLHLKRSNYTSGRPLGSLKTSASAYSYPTFISSGQQNLKSMGFTKRTPSAESLRTSSLRQTMANIIRSSLHIQRCAVSRRISNDKDSDEMSKSFNLSSVSSSLSTNEADEISSSSTVTTGTTVLNASTVRRQTPNKSKVKVRSSQSSSNSTTSNVNKPPNTDLSSSCQNISTVNSNLKISPTKVNNRANGNFLLATSQMVRSTFSRSTEKPLRAVHMTTQVNSDSPSSSHRSSTRIRRLLSSSSEISSNNVNSPKASRKPPSSWLNGKTSSNKSPLTTILPTSSNLSKSRKNSNSTNDLRKSSSINTGVFQRVNSIKRP